MAEDTTPTRPSTEQRRKLFEGPILKSLLTLAIPIVAANILQAAYQLIVPSAARVHN